MTSNINVHHFEAKWNLDILKLDECGPENNRGHRYVLVVIDNLSKFGRTVPLKKNAQTISKSMETLSRPQEVHTWLEAITVPNF